MAKQFDYDPKKAGEFYRRMARRPGMKLDKRDEHRAGAKQGNRGFLPSKSVS